MVTWGAKFELFFNFRGDEHVGDAGLACMSQRVVRSPSTPTGPRAWILPVLMPTSAPRPKRNPANSHPGASHSHLEARVSPLGCVGSRMRGARRPSKPTRASPSEVQSF